MPHLIRQARFLPTGSRHFSSSNALGKFRGNSLNGRCDRLKVVWKTQIPPISMFQSGAGWTFQFHWPQIKASSAPCEKTIMILGIFFDGEGAKGSGYGYKKNINGGAPQPASDTVWWWGSMIVNGLGCVIEGNGKERNIWARTVPSLRCSSVLDHRQNHR